MFLTKLKHRPFSLWCWTSADDNFFYVIWFEGRIGWCWQESGGRLVDFTVWDRGGQVFVVCTLEVGEELVDVAFTSWYLCHWVYYFIVSLFFLVITNPSFEFIQLVFCVVSYYLMCPLISTSRYFISPFKEAFLISTSTQALYS